MNLKQEVAGIEVKLIKNPLLMQVSRDKSGFPTNRNMIGMGAILHKVYEIKNSVYHIDHPFADQI